MIQKYEIPTIGHNSISIPEDGRVLSAKNQNNRLVVYVDVDENSRVVEWKIDVLLTGQLSPSKNSQFIDTVLLDNDTFVVHVYFSGKEPVI